jgi:hypothetical protein
MMLGRNLIFFKVVWDTFFKEGPLKLCRYASSIFSLSQLLSIYIIIVGLRNNPDCPLIPPLIVADCSVSLFVAVTSCANKYTFQYLLKKWMADVIFEKHFEK